MIDPYRKYWNRGNGSSLPIGDGESGIDFVNVTDILPEGNGLGAISSDGKGIARRPVETWYL